MFGQRDWYDPSTYESIGEDMMNDGLRRPGRGLEVDRLNKALAVLVYHATDTLFSVGERERVVESISKFIMERFILIDEASSMVVRARVDELDNIDAYIEDEDMMPIDFDPRLIRQHTAVRRTAVTAMALRQAD